jgi:hypothetical protein
VHSFGYRCAQNALLIGCVPACFVGGWQFQNLSLLFVLLAMLALAYLPGVLPSMALDTVHIRSSNPSASFSLIGEV